MEKNMLYLLDDLSLIIPLLDEEFDALDPAECEDHGENLYPGNPNPPKQ